MLKVRHEINNFTVTVSDSKNSCYALVNGYKLPLNEAEIDLLYYTILAYPAPITFDHLQKHLAFHDHQKIYKAASEINKQYKAYCNDSDINKLLQANKQKYTLSSGWKIINIHNEKEVVVSKLRHCCTCAINITKRIKSLIKCDDDTYILCHFDYSANIDDTIHQFNELLSQFDGIGSNLDTQKQGQRKLLLTIHSYIAMHVRLSSPEIIKWRKIYSEELKNLVLKFSSAYLSKEKLF